MDDIDYLLEGDPREKIRWRRKLDIFGDPVFGSRATIAQLEDTDQRCLAEFGVGFEVLQGAFNTDVAKSAGTHDFDRCIDGFIPRVDWLVAQRFLRGPCRWFCWYRKPPQFGSHIHAIASHTYDTRVGEFVPGQIKDYLADPPRNGLAGHALDLTWHPDPILRFDYEQWKQDNMALSDADKAWINTQLDAAADKGASLAVRRLLDEPVVLPTGETITVGQVLRRQGQTNDAVAGVKASVIAGVVEVKAGVSQLSTKVNNTRQTLMTKLDEIDDQVGPPAVP